MLQQAFEQSTLPGEIYTVAKADWLLFVLCFVYVALVAIVLGRTSFCADKSLYTYLIFLQDTICSGCLTAEQSKELSMIWP